MLPVPCHARKGPTVLPSGGAAAGCSSIITACSSSGSSSLSSFPEQPQRPKGRRDHRSESPRAKGQRFPKFVRRGLKSNVASIDEEDASNPFLDLLNDKFPPFQPQWDRATRIKLARERQEAGWYAARAELKDQFELILRLKSSINFNMRQVKTLSSRIFDNTGAVGQAGNLTMMKLLYSLTPGQLQDHLKDLSHIQRCFPTLDMAGAIVSAPSLLIQSPRVTFKAIESLCLYKHVFGFTIQWPAIISSKGALLTMAPTEVVDALYRLLHVVQKQYKMTGLGQDILSSPELLLTYVTVDSAEVRRNIEQVLKIVPRPAAAEQVLRTDPAIVALPGPDFDSKLLSMLQRQTAAVGVVEIVEAAFLEWGLTQSEVDVALPSLERHLKSRLRHVSLPATPADVIHRLRSLESLQASTRPSLSVASLVRQHPAILLLDAHHVQGVCYMLQSLAPGGDWSGVAQRNPHVFFLDPQEVSQRVRQLQQLLLECLGVPELPVRWFRNAKTVGRVLRLSLGRATAAARVIVELVGKEAGGQLASELDLLEAEPEALRAAYTFLRARLGVEAAGKLLKSRPRMMTAPPRALAAALADFEAMLERQGVVPRVEDQVQGAEVPGKLARDFGRVAGPAPSAGPREGSDQAGAGDYNPAAREFANAMVVRQPSLLTCALPTVEQKLVALKDATVVGGGARSGKTVVELARIMSNPEVLACLLSYSKGRLDRLRLLNFGEAEVSVYSVVRMSEAQFTALLDKLQPQ